MYAPKSERKDFEKHPAGPVALVCTRIIDYGTSFNQKKQKDTHMISFGFESSVLMKEGEYKGQPFLVFSNFNYSMYKNAKLCEFIEGWQGITLTQEDADKYDISKLIGKPLFSNIVHNEDFVNIQSPMPVPEGMTAPTVQGKMILVNLQDLDEKELEKCSEKVRERVTGSHEYKAVGSPVVESENPAAGMDNSTPQGGEGFDRDIPFNQVNCKVF